MTGTHCVSKTGYLLPLLNDGQYQQFLAQKSPQPPVFKYAACDLIKLDNYQLTLFT